MNDFLTVSVLAAFQGVAEFLPISSSGHLVILQHLFDVPEPIRLRIEIFLHGGTLLSIFVFFRSRLLALVRGLFARDVSVRAPQWRYAGNILLSSLPAVALYFAFRHSVDALMAHVRTVGVLLVFTGVVLSVTRFLPRGKRGINGWRALVMGAAQALALLPGISRSGMTLAAARAARIDPEAAAAFSFLMSAPLIVGGLVLECLQSPGETSMSALVLVWGVIFSAVVGYVSLALLMKALKGSWFWLFGPYCLLAGCLTFVFCGS